MSFDERPEKNLGEVIEDLFHPTADSSGSAGRLWKGFRMKPRGVFVGVGCVGEEACNCICGKRTCMKTASVFTFFSVRAESGDRSCWGTFIPNRSSLRSFRFGIIVTIFSTVWHTAL